MQGSALHLYKVRDTYYFRIRIPKDLDHHFNGKQELKRSLGTKSLKQARRLLTVKSYRTEEVFTTMRSGILTDEQIKSLTEAYLRDTLRACEQARAAGVGIPGGPGELRYRLLEHEETAKRLQAALTYGILGDAAQEAAKYLTTHHGLDLDLESPEFQQLVREVVKKKIEALRIEQERLQGNYNNGYDDLPQAPPSAVPVVSPSVPPPLMLSAVIDNYMKEEYHKTGKASEHSVKEYEYQCRLFLDGVGDKAITAVTREDIRTFLGLLKRFPKNAKKRKEYRGKSIAELANLEVPKGNTLNDTTISKYLTRVNTLLTWAVNENYIEKNPAAGIEHVKKKTTGKQEHYQPYDREELQSMVNGLVTVAGKGELDGKPERFWLSLIGLFTGARLNELCQLHTDDVQQEKETGIWYFRIEGNTEGTKSVKNASSNRFVPIHPKLINLGFLEYYQKVKAQGLPRLWMNLTKTSKGYHRNFSNWFLKSPMGDGFKNTYISTRPKTVFHSFRGTLITELKHKQVSESIIQDIVGHAHGTMTFDVYALPHLLKTEREALQVIDYGVDFGPLKGIT